jgi:hypothetical protein
MKTIRNPAKPIDPRQIFNHGTRFLETDQYLRNSTGPTSTWSQTIAAPTMVISVFAAELFLKCLLVLEQQDVPPTHRLDVLYRGLSHNQKRRIDELWEADARPKISRFGKEMNVPTDLPNALVKCGSAFERLRYFYEDPDGVLYYIGDFAWILMRAIVEIKPEWKPEDPPPIPPTSRVR